MVLNIVDNGILIKIKSMDLVFRYGKMVQNILGFGKMIKQMVMEG